MYGVRMNPETPRSAQHSEEDSDEALQMVSFTLGSEEFGIDILQVQEINRVAAVTRVPNAPVFVEGVINLRGKIVPVIDLRRRFRLPKGERTDLTRIIVVEREQKVVGFLVDSVRHVLHVPKSVVEPTPPMVGGVSSEYIIGIAKLDNSLLTLLDIEKILAHEEEVV